MAKKETAEQKLLKIIEQKGDEKGDQAKPAETSPQAPQPAQAKAQPEQLSAQQVEQAVKSVNLPQLNLPPFLDNILGGLKDKLQTPGAISFGMKEINNIFMVVIVLVGLILVITFFKDMNAIKKDIAFKFNTNHVKGIRSAIMPIKAVQEYLQNMSRRNIFQPYEKKKEEENAAEEENPKLKTKMENYKLVGISWLDSPETASALVEDTVSGTTYFLMQGQTVNNVTVSRIFADRIVVTYESEEMELKL